MPITTNTDVASLLGRAFTASEDTLATRIIAAAEEWIADKTGVTYKANSQKTQWLYGFPGPLVKLAFPPVVTVDSVALVSSHGAAEAVLPSTEYQIRDADAGLVYIPSLAGNVENYYSAKVVYTAGNTVPAKIKLACEIITAFWMRSALVDEAYGVANFSVGGEEQITYTAFAQEFGVPTEVWTLLSISPGGQFGFA